MQGEPSRDKDYSFARLCDLRADVTLKMWVLALIRLTQAHAILQSVNRG